MAGRIRTIKPEILDDEKTASLEHVEWRLFVSLFLIADDYGNLRADPDYVRGQTLWATKESRESVAIAIGKIADVGLVEIYTVRGQTYMHIAGWKKHQRVTHPGKPRMPGPAEVNEPDSRGNGGDSGGGGGDSRESFMESSEVLTPDSREPTTDHAGKTERDPRARAHDPTVPVPPVPSPNPDAVVTERRAILRRVHAHHREVYERTRVALNSDARPMTVVGDPAERALSKHLLELQSLETAEDDCLHALAVREAEAIAKRTVKFLGASVWSPDSFPRAMAGTVEEARSGDGRSGDISVGRYEPPPASAYGNGEQIL